MIDAGRECYDPNQWVPLSDLRNEVLIKFPNVAPVIIENELKRAAIDVAAHTKNLECEISIATEPCITEYAVPFPKGYIPQLVTQVKLCGQCIPVIDDCAFECGSMGYRMRNKNTWIEVTPAPMEKVYDGVEIVAHVGLTMDICELPPAYYHTYGRTILQGAYASLYGMVEESWYNEVYGKRYEELFSAGISRIREDTLTSANGGQGISINAHIVV